MSECPPLASLSIRLTWKTSSFGKSVSLTWSIKHLSLQAWKSPNGFFNVLLLKGLISLRATMALATTGYKNCGWSQVVQWIQTHLSIPFRENSLLMSGMLLVCNTHTHIDVYFCNPQIGNTGVFSVKLNISLPFYSQLQDLSLQISKHFYIRLFPCPS